MIAETNGCVETTDCVGFDGCSMCEVRLRQLEGRLCPMEVDLRQKVLCSAGL